MITIKHYIWAISVSLSLVSCTNSHNARTDNTESTYAYKTENEANDYEHLNVPDGYYVTEEFSGSSELNGIYKKGQSYLLITNEGKAVPAEKYRYISYPKGWVAPWDEDPDAAIQKDCYIAYINGEFMAYDETGAEIIPCGITDYKLYPYGSFLYGKSDNGWNVYDLCKYENGKRYKTPMYKIYFKNCMINADGATLLGQDNKIYLSRTDEGTLCLFEINEYGGLEAPGYREKMERQNAYQLLLLMLMNQSMTQSQINQIPQVYSNYEISSRSRSEIERDIAKYQREINFCESHINDGIAEGMGYSGIISNYNQMIRDCQNELRYAR